MRRDVAGGQPAGIQRQHNLINAGQPALPLGHDHRLEAAVAIPRHFDRDLTGVGQHRLGAFPVAGVAPVPTGRIMLVIAQMLSYLLLQGGLDHRLGQCFQQSARTGQRDPLGAGLPDQLLGRGQLLSRGRIGRIIRWWWTHAQQCFGHSDPFSPSRSSACWATYTVRRTLPSRIRDCCPARSGEGRSPHPGSGSIHQRGRLAAHAG